MSTPTLLSRLAQADARYRQALEQILVWKNPDESKAASLLFLEGYTEQARQVLPPALYAIFLDATKANAELRTLESELRRIEHESMAALPPAGGDDRQVPLPAPVPGER